MGLVSDSLLQAERNCLSFLVLAKAGGFLERSSASRRLVKSLVDAPPNSRLLTVPCTPQNADSNINRGARMNREMPCERAPRLPAGDHRTRCRGREVVSPPIRPTRSPISTRPRIAWRRPVFAGAAAAGRGGRKATPLAPGAVSLSRRADPGGLRERREAQHHSSGCVVT
jgi:hypothetical protein